MSPHGDAPGGGTMRLDVALVAHGLARSRGHARDLVDAGVVRLDGAVVRRPATPVPAGRIPVVDAGQAWVGRAAEKLVAAFEAFAPQGLSARGRRCLDVGAGTGGFTQVLLGEGAAEVVALDVGHGQLAPEVASDPRVRERSGLSIRDVGERDLGGPFDLLVADLSFISLRLVLDRLRAQLGDAGDAVLLVKPQFEVGRGRIGKGGIVRQRVARIDAVRGVVDAARDAGLWLRDATACRVRGMGGNQEYLVWFSACRDGAPRVEDVARRIDGLEAQA